MKNWAELVDEEAEGLSLGLSLRTYPGKRAELITYRHDPSRKKPGGKRRVSARHYQDEETIQAAVRRARRTIREKCLSIEADHMFTLTTRANVQNIDLFYGWFVKWIRRLRDNGIVFPYIAVAELQKRGAIHIHLATNRFLPVKVLHYHWNKIIENTDGNVDAKYFTGTRTRHRTYKWQPEKLAYYIAKYIGKETVAEFGRKRYRTSLNIKVAKQQYFTGFGLSSFYLAKIFESITDLPARSKTTLDYNVVWIASWDMT